MLVCVGFEAAGKCMEYVANRQTIENELTAWDKGRAYNYIVEKLGICILYIPLCRFPEYGGFISEASDGQQVLLHTC